MEETKKRPNSGKAKKARDIQDEKRTIFVGNLDKDTKKEDLLKLFKSYGKIDSIRFRNIVPEDITKSKKFAFITKQIHPNKKTINAFVRFKEEDSALRAAEEVNGNEFKSLHLRVDVASRSKEHDNKKSVFVGGLPFDVSDEDVYGHFTQCGDIQFVRVIRDNKTGIGKGFGYVQYKTDDSIALALKLDGSKLNERKIRVSRCVKKLKQSKTDNSNKNAKAGNVKFRGKEGSTGKKNNKGKPSFDQKKNKKSKRPLSEEELKARKKSLNKKRKAFKKSKHVSTNSKDNKKLKI